MHTPLASLLRPTTFDDMIGSRKLIGDNGIMRKYIAQKRVPSMLLWGNPGTGKTTIAYIVSLLLDVDFFHLSGVISKKEDIMKIITRAKANYQDKKQTIVFLDEIHRWNKAQQDTLLPYVEKGIITLIGATTENPSFTVNNALLSRMSVYRIDSPTQGEIYAHLKRYHQLFLKEYHKESIDDRVYLRIAEGASGDVRRSYTLLESLLLASDERVDETSLDLLPEGNLLYDRDSQEHYDLISAFHKSLRDSHGDAAIYWMGRMLAGGEDPRYIARRMINFASEDIYNLQALSFAHAIYGVCEKLGMPECELPLCNLAYFLSSLAKDNRVYISQKQMHEDIASHGSLPIPLHLRNAPNKFMKQSGYGEGYEYAHDLPGKKSMQQHFPQELSHRKYTFE